MNYEEMSDFEINVRIAENLGINWYCAPGDSPTGGWEFCSMSELMLKEDSKLKDYCNNPSDAWPIIIENRISLSAYDNKDEGWFATTDTSFFIDHDNPLRAAMISFLMMNEEGAVNGDD